MMRFGKLALVFGLGLLAAGEASAQRPGGQRGQRPGGQQPGGQRGGGFGFGGGGLTAMIGQSKQLQDELKMDQAQVEKVTEALAKVREDMRDETAKLRDRETSREDREAITKKLSEANTKALNAVLKPEQTKRLKQIENQRAGVAMFAKDDVRAALKLTDEQKEKIKAIDEDLQKDLRALAPGGQGGQPGQRGQRGQRGQGGQGGRPGGGFGGFDPEVQKKRQGLQKEAMTGVTKLLNDEQKAGLKELTGDPFELRFEGRAGGGREGGRRPGAPGKPDKPAERGKLDF